MTFPAAPPRMEGLGPELTVPGVWHVLQGEDRPVGKPSVAHLEISLREQALQCGTEAGRTEPAPQTSVAGECQGRSQIPARQEARGAALLATDASPCGASWAAICRRRPRLPARTASLLPRTPKPLPTSPRPLSLTLARVLHSGLPEAQQLHGRGGAGEAGSYRPTAIFPFLLPPPTGSQVGSSGNKNIATNYPAFTVSATVLVLYLLYLTEFSQTPWET